MQWNYNRDDLARIIDKTAEGGRWTETWATGNRIQGIEVGDRAFLLKQGDEPRGIIAAGWFTSTIRQASHWNGEGSVGNYADLEWDAFVDPSDPLLVATLDERAPDRIGGHVPAGIRSSQRSLMRLSECGTRTSQLAETTQFLERQSRAFAQDVKDGCVIPRFERVSRTLLRIV